MVYASVSTEDQNLEIQRDRLSVAGCEMMFEEKMSGAVRGRPELEKLMGTCAKTTFWWSPASIVSRDPLCRAGPHALPDGPGGVFADSADLGSHFREAVRANGGTPRIVATGMWGRDEQETLCKLNEWNQPIHRVRGRIEKIFRTWKRSYGLRRMRWRGIAKAAVQIHLTAIAYKLKRTFNIVQQAG